MQFTQGHALPDQASKTEVAPKHNQFQRFQTGKDTFDFRHSEPAHAQCHCCQQSYRDWEVTRTEWELLPEQYREMMLCEKDYLDLIQQAGHDPADVQITHRASALNAAAWQEDDIPPHHTKIRIITGEGDDAMIELLWCVVLKSRGERLFEVELGNNCINNSAFHIGVRLLAKWDGEAVHGISGRPILEPIQRLQSHSRKVKKRERLQRERMQANGNQTHSFQLLCGGCAERKVSWEK